MSYLDLPVIDDHIHIHTNDNDVPRVSTLKRHEEIVEEIFEKTNDEAITLLASGFASDYKYEVGGNVNLIENAIGYYLKDKIQKKIYFFGAFSRDFHKPDKNTRKMYLEQAKFRVAAGCDGFKSLDGLLTTYRNIGARFSDPVTELYFEYLEKNRVPIAIHLLQPNNIFEKDCVMYVGEDKIEETRILIKDIKEDVEELLNKFPKLTLIIPHFYFLSHDLDEAERFMTKYENVYFDLTPNIFMYYDFNKYNDEELRAFFKRISHKLIYGTDTFIEEGILDIPIQVNVVRDYFEKEQSEFLSGMGIKTLPMDEDFLKKIYYENFIGIVGNEPRKVNAKMAIEECDCLLTEYRAWLSKKDIDFLIQIKNYFENGEK